MNIKMLNVVLLMSALGMQACEQTCCSSSCSGNPFFVLVGTGYSWSMCSKICVDEIFWDKAAEGYNSKLNSVPVFEAGLGYYFRPWIGASVTAAYRGIYHYKKCQTVEQAVVIPAGAAETRYFDLANTSVLFNLILNGTNCLAWHFCNDMSLAPVVVGGVGIAQNKVFNFHTVTDQQVPNLESFYVKSIMSEFVNKFTFAAHADIGVAWTMCERAQLNLGYRFYYGGEFKTNKYLVDIPGGLLQTQITRPITIPGWCSSLKANELFADLSFMF